jgi:CDP-alcohol phosphatidyltransferase-like enzyme
MRSRVLPSYAEIRAAYGGAKAAQDRRDLMARFFARPLSFPVAWIALRLGATPNGVTAAYLGMNVVGLVMMASGQRAAMATGVGVIILALVLDCADGNMARAMKRFSPMGEWLEGVGAYVLSVGFHLCGGFGAWRAHTIGDAVTSWPRTGDAGGWLVAAGAIAGATITVSMLAAAKFSAVFPEVDRGQLVARVGGGLYGALFTVGRNLSFASGLVLPLTLIGILTRRYEVVLGGFAVLNTGMMLTVLWRCVVLASRPTRGGVP